MVPPNGWHYQQPYQGVLRKIEGSGYTDLIDQITKYRIDHGITLGNPENDYEAWLCSNYPANCNRSTQEAPAETKKPRTFRERVTSWAANRYARAGTVNLVSQEVANQRAEICSTCPYNQAWREGCPPCIEATDRTLLLIRQNKKPERAVLGCAIAGHDNSAACFMPEPLLRHRKAYTDQLPGFCWLRQLDENS
jgi:hypothetical protein